MLINPAAAQNVSQAPVEQMSTGQAFGVPADIPPVDSAPRSEGNQNQATDHGGRQERRATDSADAMADKQAQARSRENADSAAHKAEDDALLRQLQTRDREVRVHESAHAAVGGAYAGAAQLRYTRGPDGAQYATSGEVGISTSKVSGNPQATIDKARTIKAAALAPADPSAQDRRVASQAIQMELQARVDLSEMKQVEQSQREESVQENNAEQRVDDNVKEVETADIETAPEVSTYVAPSTTQQAQANLLEGASARETTAAADHRKEKPQVMVENVKRMFEVNKGNADINHPQGRNGVLDVIV